MTYFEWFDLAPAYLIDTAALKAKYLGNSRLYHPDHYALRDESVKIEAEEKSAFNNKAYQTLVDPDARLKYILQLHHSIQDEEVYTLDQLFLMEMLDLNDMVSEDPAQATVLIENREAGLYDEIKPALELYSSSNPDENVLLKLKDYYYKRKYLQRIKENIERANNV